MNATSRNQEDVLRKAVLRKGDAVVLLGILCACLGVVAGAQEPLLAVRFANPQLDCVAGTYCVDVEFQSDTPDQELFGMNVRFFYEDTALDFHSFTDFQAGYGPVSPYPPQVNVGGPDSGANLFSFDGPAVYVNGAIELLDWTAPTAYISTTDWTRLFSVCFTVSDPDALAGGSFCPSVLWDLASDPARGGFLRGSSGIVMTVIAPPPMESAPAQKSAVPFNSVYYEGADGPFTVPVLEACITADCTAVARDDEDYGDDVDEVVYDAGASDEGGDAPGLIVLADGDDADADVEGEGVDDGAGDDESESGDARGDSDTTENDAVEGEAEDADETRCGGYGCAGGKSLKDWLGDWLLIGLSLLALLSLTTRRKR